VTVSALHLSHAAHGGAGRAARRAALACQTVGIEAGFAFVSGTPRGDTEIRLDPEPPTDAAEAALADLLGPRLRSGYIAHGRTPLSNTLLSMPYPAVALDRHGAVVAADVLHLHWTTWLVGPRTIAGWIEAGRALVWTLHDLWPLTGGCHYPAGCLQWRTACIKCPQLDDPEQLVPNAFAEKRACYGAGGLTVIAPSRWMAEIARTSAVLGGATAVVVPNAVETDLFAPREDRQALRAGFGIGPDDLVLVWGADDAREARKGGKVLAEALGRSVGNGVLAATLPAGAEIVLIGFGRHATRLEIPGLRHLLLGPIDEDEVLVDVLGLADATCLASLEDNSPNIAIESLACGTPVVAFAVGGLPEIVDDGRTGVLAVRAGDAAALGEALLRFATRHRGDARMRAACRAQVMATNAPAKVGGDLAEVYGSVLAASRARRAPRPAEVHRRVRRAFARAPVADSARPGPDFLRYPANHWLRAEAGAVVAKLAVREEALPSRGSRILAVRAHHAHHAAQSGPYQFLRHLPPRLRVEHLAVPLGEAQAGTWSGTYRAAAMLRGAAVLGQQINAWLAQAEIMAECARLQTDLVHAIDGEALGLLLEGTPDGLFAGGRRPRLVATLHQPPALLDRLLGPLALSGFDSVVVLTEAMRDWAAARLGADRVVLIPHGVDTDFFTPGPPSGAAEGPFRLLAVGRWMRDYQAALRALARIRGCGVDARLTIVCPEFPLRLPGEEVAVIEGLSDTALRQAYRDADALFLPLTEATANNAILEALACGLPVISTEVGGVPAAVGEAGLLAPVGDDAALAAAVLVLARDGARRAALGAAARARAEALDWRVVAARHAELYDRLIAS
jgi:glycosyltransferase involved in cell wall biosynthesis